MDALKKKKVLSILLLVVPLAVGIPLAMYLIPSSKTTTQTTPHFDFTAKKDSVELKLDIIIKRLNELDTRLKKLEPVKPAIKDTVLIPKPLEEKDVVKKETVLLKKETALPKKEKQKPSPVKHK